MGSRNPFEWYQKECDAASEVVDGIRKETQELERDLRILTTALQSCHQCSLAQSRLFSIPCRSDCNAHRGGDRIVSANELAVSSPGLCNSAPKLIEQVRPSFEKIKVDLERLGLAVPGDKYYKCVRTCSSRRGGNASTVARDPLTRPDCHLRRFNGMWKGSIRQVCFAAALVVFLEKHTLITLEELEAMTGGRPHGANHLPGPYHSCVAPSLYTLAASTSEKEGFFIDLEDFLFGLCTLSAELVSGRSEKMGATGCSSPGGLDRRVWRQIVSLRGILGGPWRFRHFSQSSMLDSASLTSRMTGFGKSLMLSSTI